MALDNLTSKGTDRVISLFDRLLRHLETLEPEQLIRVSSGGKLLTLLYKAMEIKEQSETQRLAGEPVRGIEDALQVTHYEEVTSTLADS